ncbi:DoxX family protein [Gracilibacillus thailandensis]|uniref:DoxX family membrane protein n=1 Tax=Gracilibacillus thailandensis TaxID=563735 RepID=A0A6N7QUX7_9BACI|nr:DoxX family protein [Gracilibacillus thailandensis]MRI64751.1 DoxX family membrane protein [Gracilibacillus thailandensis]
MPRNISSYQLIRYVVGYVFIASALMKLVIADFTGPFSNYGVPYPQAAVLIVGITELICGVIIVFNYYVKKAAIPLLVIIVAAIFLTKVPVLQAGLLEFAFEARLDIVMFFLLYILWKD